MKIDNITIDEIEARHQGCHILSNSLGLIWDEGTDTNVEAEDVLVWATEADSIDDDGSKAIARYTVRV